MSNLAKYNLYGLCVSMTITFFTTMFIVVLNRLGISDNAVNIALVSGISVYIAGKMADNKYGAR